MTMTQEGLEWAAEFSLDSPTLVGRYEMSGAGSGAFSAEDPIPAGARVFILVATSDLGESDCQLTLNGALGSGTAVSAQAVVPGRGCVGYGYKAAFAADVQTLTGVTASGGQAGDTYDILALPLEAKRTNLTFIRNLRSSEGVTFRNVPRGYDSADHQKRVRGENSVSFEGPRQTGHSGLLALKNRRNYTLIFQKDTDGDGVIAESLIFEKVSGSLASINPLQEGGPVIDAFEGSFNRAVTVLDQV